MGYVLQKKVLCWVITEGLIGTENQCIGIADALDLPYLVKRISLKQPWKSFSPYLAFEHPESFIPRLEPPWPELIIASGRKSIAASRFIKKASNGKTITVQIQDPRISSCHFDLVAVPEHDPLRGPNVFVTKATPNKIEPQKLEKARTEFTSLNNLPSPRIAVLIGGNSKAYKMTQDITKNIAQTLSDIDGSLMITCSRRTGVENEAILRDHLDTDANFFWDGIGDNPYMAFLAYADMILVTADSASMISESCTTGKPTYMIPLEGGKKRIKRLHRNLTKHGCLREFPDALNHYEYEPLNDAKLVANEIKRRFGSLLDNADG